MSPLYGVGPMLSPRTVRGFLPCLLAVGVVCASVEAQSPKPHPTAAKSATSPKPGASPAPSYVLPDVVATVDGEAIKKADLERVTAELAASEGKAIKDLTPAAQQQAYTTVLDNLVVDKLVSKAAADEAVDPMAVYKRYDALASQYPAPQAFADLLKKSGETPDRLRETLRKQLAQQQWLEKQIADQIKVAPQEVEKFYKESPPGKFDQPELIHAEHILAAVRKDAPPEDALAAEDKINALAERVKKGEAFDQVARKESDDKSAQAQLATTQHPASPGNGGDLGWFSQDRVMPEFGAVAFKLKPGEVSTPVRTQFGYHLIKVLERKPASTATLSEAREQITAFLVSEKRQKAVAQVVKGLQEQSKIATFLPKAG